MDQVKPSHVRDVSSWHCLVLCVSCIYISADYPSPSGGHFECDNGNCRGATALCNGYDDCGDNSDEVGCGGSDGPGMYHLCV